MNSSPGAGSARESRLLIASPDQVTLSLMRRYLDAADDHRASPTSIIQVQTLEQVHAALIEEPPPTAVLLDAHFEQTAPNDQLKKIMRKSFLQMKGVKLNTQILNYAAIRRELADCRERYLGIVLANGNGARDVLPAIQREMDGGLNPNALIKLSVLQEKIQVGVLFTHMEAYLKKPPSDGTNTPMLSLLGS